jgi:hypothetical protein
MIDRLLTVPERWPGRVIAVLGLLFAITYGASLVVLAKPTGRVVMGDAVHYYVYLRSAVFDGDLDFENEYVRIYQLRGGEFGTEWVYEPTATGHTRNLMSIGPALAWAPLYLVVTAVTWLLHAVGVGAAGDGYGRLFEGSAGVSGAMAATIGAYLAYRAAAQLTSARAAIWATLIMWLGSSAIYYSLISPTYSHAISMLTVGIYLLTWLTTRDRQTIGRYALVGFLCGLASLVRWQDAVLLIIPAIDAAWHALLLPQRVARVRLHDHVGRATANLDGGSTRGDNVSNQGKDAGQIYSPLSRGEGGSGVRVLRALTNLAACGLAATLAFLPQMMVWNTLYGSPFLVPQGEEFMKWTAPALVSVLFSEHGLISWTPIVAVSLAGLVMLWKREPMVAAALGVAMLVSWYTNAAVADWWAGEAYGARRFVSCFPIFAIGLAAAIQPLAERQADNQPAPRPLHTIAAFAVVVITLNGLLLLQYQTFMHGLRTLAPYPKGGYDLWLARFVVPFDLLRWLLS